MKFYILCHQCIDWLKHHAKTIPFKDQVVVINSLDNDFVDQASTYCQENSIEYHITESDGTPATGKNSVMRVFLESDNEYMVQVDGDDEITEYGYQFYTDVSKRECPPDSIIIYNQFQRATDEVLLDKETREVIGSVSTSRSKPWTRSSDFCFWTDEFRSRNFSSVPEEDVNEWEYTRKVYFDWFWRLGEGEVGHSHRDIFQRMVFFSRKAAELAHFDPKLFIGDDTIATVKMKEHFRRGDIKMVRHNEDRGDEKYTYLYWFDRKGIMRTFMESDVSWSSLPINSDYSWYITIVDYMEENNIFENYKHLENLTVPDII